MRPRRFGSYRISPPRPLLLIGAYDFADADGDNAVAFWRAAIDPLIVAATARRAHDNDSEALNLWALPMAATVLQDCEGFEHVLLADGPRHLRLQLVGDSIADGPVQLSYTLSGLTHLEPAILSLRRLSAVGRLGKLPRTLFPPDPIVARRVQALQAWDGAQKAASQREIAIAIFGRHMVTESSFYSMRKRVHRLLQLAEQRIHAAWQRFFSS